MSSVPKKADKLNLSLTSFFNIVALQAIKIQYKPKQEYSQSTQPISSLSWIIDISYAIP